MDIHKDMDIRRFSTSSRISMVLNQQTHSSINKMILQQPQSPVQSYGSIRSINSSPNINKSRKFSNASSTYLEFSSLSFGRSSSLTTTNSPPTTNLFHKDKFDWLYLDEKKDGRRDADDKNKSKTLTSSLNGIKFSPMKPISLNFTEKPIETRLHNFFSSLLNLGPRSVSFPSVVLENNEFTFKYNNISARKSLNNIFNSMKLNTDQTEDISQKSYATCDLNDELLVLEEQWHNSLMLKITPSTKIPQHFPKSLNK